MDYTVIYSKRKTLNITVERDRSVVVRAPEATSKEKIAEILEKKKLWLYQKINHPQKFNPNPPKKEYISGESFLFLGMRYQLEVQENPPKLLDLNENFILAETAKTEAPALFKAWYTKQGEQLLPPRIQQFAAELGVEYNAIKIVDTQFRWGSCTPKNNLHFNWRILKAPYFVIDYLIVHELTHLKIANHTPDFWNLVSVVLPEWKEGKDWLKEFGKEM